MNLDTIEVLGFLGATIVGGGGLVGLLTLFVKGRPEAGKIVVDAATGLVVIQAGTIDRLNARLDALELSARERDAREADLRREIEELKSDLADALHERDSAALDVGRLRKRIARLEEGYRALNAPIPPE